MADESGYFCTNCGSDVNKDDSHCYKCGTTLSSLDSDVTNNTEQTKRYPILRGIARAYRILAVIVGLGVFFGLGITSEKLDVNPLIIVGGLLSGIVVVLTLLAFSEAIMVFLDIEFNTRKTHPNNN